MKKTMSNVTSPFSLDGLAPFVQLDILATTPSQSDAISKPVSDMLRVTRTAWIVGSDSAGEI